MPIQVHMPVGKPFNMEIHIEKTTVNEVRKKVMEKSGMRLDEIAIFYNNDFMKNNNTLKECGIENGAIIDAETAETIANKLKQKITITEEDVIKWQQKFNQQLTQNDELNDKLANVSKQLNGITQENGQLQQELSQVKAWLENSKKKNLQSEDSQLQQNQQQKQQFQGIDIKKLEMELAQQKAIINRFDVERAELQQQIQYFKQEKLDLQRKGDDYQKLKDETIRMTYEIKGLQKDLEFAKNISSQTKDEIIKELDFSRQKIKQLEQLLEEAKLKNQEMSVEKMKQEMRSQINLNNVDRLNELQQQNTRLEKRIDEYKAQVFSLNSQVKQLQNKNQDDLMGSMNKPNFASLEKINGYELQITKLSAELKSSQQSFNESQEELSSYKKQCFENNKKINELEKSMECLKNLLNQKDKGIKEKEQFIKQLQMEIEELKKDLSSYQKNLRDFKQIALSANPKKVLEIESEALKVEEKLKEREEQRNREQQRLEKERQEELKGRQEKLKQEQLQNNDLMQRNKEQRQRTAQFLKRQMMESHDVTKSMDPYKEQAMRCIKESMQNIKIKTNRDALWATVAYQDFLEQKQLGGLYYQLNFTSNPKEIEDYLATVSCNGGGDAAEDIRGGIKQMVQNLSWSKTFKIAILICDAPTHGSKYNGGVSDRHPNEDIEDAINMLIEKNILLVAILFNQSTLIMFEEIKKMYTNAEKEELLLFANLENTQQGQIWQELVDLVSQASQRATQTNNKGTRSKNNQADKRSQSGAMEALCKSIKDPFKFDQIEGIKIIPVKFGVYRVELKQDSFEANIENLKRLDINKDYSVYQEGQWDCIRTEKYFAEGQMKQVFLMKRQNNQNELYVIKMPIGDSTYKSQEQAIVECRSHLISKCLMKKFIRELQDARDKIDRSVRIPEVQYSDFLILKDLKDGNSFWIAERFFSGDFVKYNNNYGFISDDNTDINHLAQAYTYYTYFVSNFNYMVNDIQGVGNYFTDPALNTKDSNFDETDMGIDGQSMFMVSYEGKKHMGRKYLDMLNIPQP